MNSTASSAITEVHAALYLNGPSKSVAAQTTILEAIAAEPATAPTHGSLNDRKRLPFSLETLAIEAGARIGAPWLWRLTPPKYWASLDASPLPIARLFLHYEDIAAKNVEPVCRGIAHLVDRLQPAYAALHFHWADSSPEWAASMQGFSAKALYYCRYGPPGIFSWTWFGPSLVERFGLALLQSQGAIATPWGGASLPLVECPWTAPFETLRARQLAVDQALRPPGVFGNYFEPVPRPGPQWTPLAGPPLNPA